MSQKKFFIKWLELLEEEDPARRSNVVPYGLLCVAGVYASPREENVPEEISYCREQKGQTWNCCTRYGR